MESNQLKAAFDEIKENKARVRSFSMKVTNGSSDTDDSIYIATSYDMLSTANGHPASDKGIAGQAFEVETQNRGRLSRHL